MSVLDFIDSNVFTPVFNNDVPLISSPRVEAICTELQLAIRNRESIFLYGDYDMDGMCSVMVWKEVLSSLQAEPPVIFKYVSRTHILDRDILNQVKASNTRVAIICDTGSGFEDKMVISLLRSQGCTPIIIDHHTFTGFYNDEYFNSLVFNSYMEKNIIGGDVSGAYTSLLVAKVLCEKYMNKALPFNAKVFALGSMYSDCVDMSTPIARALYSSVALAKAQGPSFFNQINKWNYLYGRRFFSYIVAPKINGCFRMERLDILNNVMLADNKFKMQSAVESLSAMHEEASRLTKAFVGEFERVRIGEIVLCVHELTDETRMLHIRNFTGVVASRIAEEEKTAVVVVVKDEREYSGSFRDYYSREMLETFKLFADCAGHPAAFKVSFFDLNDFTKHLGYLGSQLSSEYDKPYITLNSGVITGDEDINAIALYNEYMNVKPFVVISHKCTRTSLSRSTAYNKYYSVGLPTEKLLLTTRSLIDGSFVLIEPAICRGVELREMV